MINLMDLADTVITLEETAPDTVEMTVQTQDGNTIMTLHRTADGVLVEQPTTAAMPQGSNTYEAHDC